MPGDPGTFEAIPLCSTYLFCSGHAAMADGRILNVGGMIKPVDAGNASTLGTPDTNQFDPAAPVGSNWSAFKPTIKSALVFAWTCNTLFDVLWQAQASDACMQGDGK